MLIPLSAAHAQSSTAGAIGGTVYDNTGAALANVAVKATNEETGQTFEGLSGVSGAYYLPSVTPGRYAVVFTASGFEVYKANAVVVTVGALADVTPSLKVGSVSNTVEVTEEASDLHTQSSEISSTIDQNAIDNLPINGRRWSSFALLTPGVVSNSDGFGLLSFRGISYLLNNSTVDGADNNQAYFSEERGRTRVSYSVSQAAVQEFQVNASNYSAIYGRSAGGVINTVTKSGGNHLHGELFFYDRDNEWGATNPYTQLTTENTSTGAFNTYVYKPKDWRKQWGFGAGGPLIHGKLFWFYSYDQSHRNFPGTARASDTADTFAFADSTLPSGTACSGGSFSGSTSSASAGDVYACKLANVFGISYAAGAAYYTQGLGVLSTFLGTVPRQAYQELNFPKLDWQINDKNHLTVQYNRLRYEAPAGVQTQRSNLYGRSSFGNDFVKEDFGILRLATVLTPNLVSNFIFQYGRDYERETSQTPTANEQPLSQTIAGDPLAPAAPPDTQIGYYFDLSGFDIGRTYFLERRALPDEHRMQGEEMFTWSRGNHIFKAGAEVNRVFDFVDNLYEEGGSYSYDYNWDFIADYLHATTGLGGSSYTPQFYSLNQGFGNPRFEFATTDYAGFATDDWRILPRLTLTLGLRYEYEYIPKNPLQNTTPATGLSSSAQALPQTANKVSDRNNFGPRVGFALDVYGNHKTFLRGGYGIFYGRIINSNIMQTDLLSGGTNSQITLQASSSNTCGMIYPKIFATASDYMTACGSGYSSTVAYLDSHLQNPQVHEADLALEQDLGWNTSFSLTYMGSFGREMAAAIDRNVAPATSTTSFVVLDNVAAPTSYPALPHGGKALPLLHNSTHTYKKYTAASGNYPGYYHVLDFRSEVNSSYNALAAQLNHRFSHNFSLLASFTWAKAMDYNPYLSTGYGTSTEVLDPYNPAGEYAISSLNVGKRFVGAATYRTNFSRLSHWQKQALNGWSIAPIVQVQTGLPYSAGVVTINSVGGVYSGVLGVGGTARIPDIGRNAFNYPLIANTDLRLSKNFSYDYRDQHFRFELLAEAFNLLNHQNITSVYTNAYCITKSPTTSAEGCSSVTSSPTVTSTYYMVGNPRFGMYNNANSNTFLSERQIQLAGRLYF